MKKFRWDKKYLYWGVTAFCVIVACLVFYMLLTNFAWLKKGAGELGGILSPFIWGLVISYLIYPLVRIYQRSVFTPFARWIYKKSPRGEEKAAKLGRVLAITFGEISLIILVAAMIWMVAPQLFRSIESIIASSNDYYNTVYGWIERFLDDNPQAAAFASEALGNISDLSGGFNSWLSGTVMPHIEGLIAGVTTGVVHVVKSLFNIIIGMIVSVYVLYNKDTFGAHLKKILYCIFSVEAGAKILDGVDFVNSVFMGFISGKILDSAIIAVLCYVGCTILGMPYALLVSFIVGVTNIIPFFGPFIGAVPSAIIILMESPLQCLIFVIFVFALQQFDGNILGPKILGSSVGINGFWVMFSIIVGAGLFGFMGMLLGVPVFVILYAMFTALINRKLKRSGLPTETAVYKTMDHIDPVTGECVAKVEQPRRKGEGKKPSFHRSSKKTAAAQEKPAQEEKVSGEQQP